jgi:hypothetical protein
LIKGGGDQALECKIFGEWDVAQHEILYVLFVRPERVPTSIA